MEESLYSSLGNKIRDKKDQKAPMMAISGPSSVKDCLKGPWKVLEKKQIFNAYLNDLKILLEEEGLLNLAKGILELENNIAMAREKLGIEDSANFPSMENFFSCLSPILLRSILEIPSLESKGGEISKNLLEGLRVALEDEIYNNEDNFSN